MRWVETELGSPCLMRRNHLSKNKEHSSWQDLGILGRKIGSRSYSALRAVYELPVGSGRATKWNVKCIASIFFFRLCVETAQGRGNDIEIWATPSSALHTGPGQ